jgi:hypothetical protein
MCVCPSQDHRPVTVNVHMSVTEDHRPVTVNVHMSVTEDHSPVSVKNVLQVKVTVTFILEQATKAQRGSGNIALAFL